jgi:hypothetical protein
MPMPHASGVMTVFEWLESFRTEPFVVPWRGKGGGVPFYACSDVTDCDTTLTWLGHSSDVAQQCSDATSWHNKRLCPEWLHSHSNTVTPETWASEELNLFLGISSYFWIRELYREGLLQADLR